MSVSSSIVYCSSKKYKELKIMSKSSIKDKKGYISVSTSISILTKSVNDYIAQKELEKKYSVTTFNNFNGNDYNRK